MAEISGGLKLFGLPSISTWMWASPLAALTSLYGTRSLLAAALVVLAAHEALHGEDGILRIGDGLALGGLADEALAVLVKATTEGVVRAPSEFSRTTGSPPSMTDMQELVVPKSIPRIFDIALLFMQRTCQRFYVFLSGFIVRDLKDLSLTPRMRQIETGCLNYETRAISMSLSVSPRNLAAAILKSG